MESIYIGYKCEICKREMVLPSEDVRAAKQQGRYLACAYCGCKILNKTKETDDLRKCFSHSTYRRQHGAVRQVRQE